MRRWLQTIAEIRRDPGLRLYGALLAATEILSYLWLRQFDAARLVSEHDWPICWPFFEHCEAYRLLDQGGVEIVMAVQALLALASIGFFAKKRATPLAWIALLGSELVLLTIVAQDFRLRLNQHTLQLFAIAAFLFFPGKKWLLRRLLVLFYVAAGLLKLDAEWLTGAAIPVKMVFLDGPLLPVACAYVVVLELAIVWGTLAKRPLFFWGALAQLVLFHLMSWQVVGFFYPLLMLALLSIHVIDTRPVRRRSYALLAIFVALQAVPFFFPGDTAITGQGRLFSLHMFDARIVCSARAEIHGGRSIDLKSRLPPRINCDPIVYLNRARALCRRGGELDLFLDSRRSTEAELRPVIRIERFCSRDIEYDLWRNNPWISSTPPR